LHHRAGTLGTGIRQILAEIQVWLYGNSPYKFSFHMFYKEI